MNFVFDPQHYYSYSLATVVLLQKCERVIIVARQPKRSGQRVAERATRYCGYVISVSIILAARSMTSSALQVTSTAEYIWYQYNSDCPSYNVRTQRSVKRQCTLTYIYERSMLNANVSVSPRTLCLHDERNARKNREVKASRLFANNR